MSDYTNTFNGALRDANTEVIYGADFDTQFDAIASMSSTKINKIASPTVGNVATQTSTGEVQDSGYSFPNLVGAVTADVDEINKLDGLTATTAELNLLSGKTGTIWTSDNDGSGSGLDADLLDGHDQSYFINTAGGQTINGGLTLTGTLVPSVSVRIKGNGVGDANVSWIGFYESDGTTRQSYVGSGSGSDSDLHLYTEQPSTGVRIATRDSAGTSHLAAIFDGAAQSVKLYNNGSQKFTTTANGIYISGEMVASGLCSHASYHTHYDYDDGPGSANYVRSYLRDGIYYTYGAGNAADWTHRLQKGSLHVGYGKSSGNTYLIIEADVDNNNESDHPILQFKQDGGGVDWRVELGGLDGNALALRNAIGATRTVEFRNQADTTTTAKVDCETGDATFNGDVTVGGNLTVNGTASVNGVPVEGRFVLFDTPASVTDSGSSWITVDATAYGVPAAAQAVLLSMLVETSVAPDTVVLLTGSARTDSSQSISTRLVSHTVSNPTTSNIIGDASGSAPVKLTSTGTFDYTYSHSRVLHILGYYI